MSDAPDDLFEAPDGVIKVGRFDTVFAGVYNKGLYPSAFEDLLRWQHGVMPASPIVSYSLAFGSERLDKPTTAAANRLLAEFRDQTRASVTIVASQGFDGSAARAMLATIYLLTRAAYPRKVVADVASGHAWLRSQMSDPSPLERATRWLEAFERDYRTQTA